MKARPSCESRDLNRNRVLSLIVTLVGPNRIRPSEKVKRCESS